MSKILGCDVIESFKYVFTKKMKEALYEQLQPEVVYITQIGLNKLKAKLSESEELLESRRAEAAIESGDEGIHHDEAAREARFDFFKAEDTVTHLKGILSSQIAIIEPNDNTEMVDIGNTVTVEFLDEGESEKLVIVGKHDGDAHESFVSYESPMAKAILGKKRGEEVSFEVGQNRMQINVKIKRIEQGNF